MGSLWAYVWPPLILLSVDGIIDKERWGFPALAASYGLLVFSHPPTTLCFSTIPLFAALYLAQPQQRLRTLLKTGSAMALGVGIAASFFLPAILDQKKAHVDAMAGGWFDPSHWWLFQFTYPFTNARGMMWMTLATIGFAGVAFWIAWRSRPDNLLRRRLLFFLWVLLGALFMTSQLSAPVWAAIPPLRQLQFPVRFLQSLVMAATALSALAYPYLAAKRTSLPTIVASALFLSFIAADAAAASQAFSVWRPFPPALVADRANLMRYEQELMSFWPRPAPMPSVIEFPAFSDFVAQYPPRSMVLTGTNGENFAAPEIRSWRPRQILLAVHAPKPARLVVRHFYYAGWKARIAKSGADIAVAPNMPGGFLQLDVPAGDYELELNLSKEAPERFGDWISRASIGILFVLVWFSTSRKQD